MIGLAAKASVYTDFQGLAELRAAAGKQSPEALRETARQFEAIFVQSMLKSMRDASGGEGLFDSEQSNFYRDIYDRQMSLEMVKGRGLGVADMLMKSIGGGVDESQDATALQQNLVRHTGMLAPMPVANSPAPLVSFTQGEPLIEIQAADASGSVFNNRPAAMPDGDWNPQTPEQFIRELMPHAVRGAAELGVEPGVIVAQAALETGWGRKMIRHPDGTNSFNLFGIKADTAWQGPRVQVPTLEYEGGVAVRKRDAFRSFSSLGDAVSGYVDFLKQNPRYRQALSMAGDSASFLNGLQQAGYATDPRYAEKIRSIMQRDGFGLDTDQLALSESTPLF